MDGSRTASAGLPGLNSLEVRNISLASAGDAQFGITREPTPRLAILAQKGSRVFSGFEGEASAHGSGTLLLCPTSVATATALREYFAWLEPHLLGVGTSAGLGDRLGLATPGHVRAMRAAGGNVTPIFAQQSIREMERTGRTPRQVMDDATWGVFTEGWRGGFGADADHLKTPADVDACVAAGYTFRGSRRFRVARHARPPALGYSGGHRAGSPRPVCGDAVRPRGSRPRAGRSCRCAGCGQVRPGGGARGRAVPSPGGGDG